MPEIAEVARVVHFLRLHLVGKKVLKVSAQDDSSVFGKAGTSGAEFAAALKGKKVVSAGSQGKYFWLVLDKPPHPVMHLGMTGWVHIRGVRSAYTNYYKKMKPGEEDQWPPKYAKFHIETDGSPAVEVAYTDPRRFGRVRLVDCPGKDIRQHSPLVENGPDPVVDSDVFTEDYLSGKMRARHVPIKALLLDQAMISGIGNWVGDEVLYQARLHPEQYSNKFSDAEITRLYDAIRDVCGTAVDLLGDSDQFPEHWLFNHRWGKGAKSSKLPNGEKLAFVTVGGRTSCYAPNMQKNSGAVAPGIKEEPLVVTTPVAATKKGKGKRGKDSSPEAKTEDAEEDTADGEEPPESKKRRVSRTKDTTKQKQPMRATSQDSKAAKVSAARTKKGKKADEADEATAEAILDAGRRRSGRLQK